MFTQCPVCQDVMQDPFLYRITRMGLLAVCGDKCVDKLEYMEIDEFNRVKQRILKEEEACESN